MYYNYILEGKEPVHCDDIETWSKWYQTANRRVASTFISDDVRVSTVFLAMDHNWHGGEKILFETMVFGGRYDDYQERYHTWDEAEEGHKRIVEMVRRGKELIS